MVFKAICLTVMMLTTLHLASCQNSAAKDKVVGGRCEGCEAALEFGSRTLNSRDTLPDFDPQSERRLLVTGTIFKKDGRTPAGNVILYIYHTDQEGIYPTRGNEKGWDRRHGYIRGWVKTGPDGKYSFYTLRPGAYPGRENPEHIHATVKEPGIAPYYIDDFHFDDDPILTASMRRGQRNRGGNGIVSVSKARDGMPTVTRDIVLGENIPEY